jgi:hypothetical protein
MISKQSIAHLFKGLNQFYKLILLISLFSLSCSEQSSEHIDRKTINDAILEPVSYLDVELTDNFWKPKIEINSVNGLRSVFEKAASAISNFDIAAGKKEGKHVSGSYDDRNRIGYVSGVANDSDVYKINWGIRSLPVKSFHKLWSGLNFNIKLKFDWTQVKSPKYSLMCHFNS